jgi:hypothetical protein
VLSWTEVELVADAVMEEQEGGVTTDVLLLAELMVRLAVDLRQ